MMRLASLEDIQRLEARGPWQAPVASTYELLRRSATRHRGPALVALADDASPLPDRCLDYSGLLHRVSRFANALHRVGVERGDVVSLRLPHGPELHVALLGAQAVGIAHPVDPGLAPGALAGMLRAARTTLLVLQAAAATPTFVQLVRRKVPTLRMIVVVGSSPGERVSGCIPFDDLLSRGSGVLAPGIPLPSAEDVCLVLQTGGTSDPPRLARLSHGNLVYAATMLEKLSALEPGSVLLCAQPLHHVSGVVVGGLLPLQLGARIVLPRADRPGPAQCTPDWSIIDRHGVTALFASPALLGELADAPTAGTRLSSLRHIFCGGAGLAPGLARRVERLTGARVLEGYGLTEATCVSTFSPATVARTPGSVGLRLPFQRLRCARMKAGAWDEVPTGVAGEVHVRGPNVFPGYVDARLDSEVMLPDGWLATGDLGFLDEAGQLHLVGRQKDVIVRAGRKIEPSRIERVLSLHPDVASVAVVARPDIRSGEVPVAYVVLHVGATSSAETLSAHCAIALRDPHAVPLHLRILPSLPLLSSGKVDKASLRQIEASRAVRESLRSEGASVTVRADRAAGEAIQLVIENIPRGRRPTVARVMERFAISWRYGDARSAPAAKSPARGNPRRNPSRW